MGIRINRHLSWKMLLVLLAGLGCLAVLVGCSTQSNPAAPVSPTQAAVSTPEPDQPTATAAAQEPALDGAQLLQARCATCHNLNRVTQEKGAAAEWEQTVTRMVRKGAKLTDGEKATLVEYLAKTYAP